MVRDCNDVNRQTATAELFQLMHRVFIVPEHTIWKQTGGMCVRICVRC